MPRSSTVRLRFADQLEAWLQEFRITAWEAFDNAMANIVTPAECADVVLMAVEWGNPGHIKVALYVMPNAGKGVAVDE